MLIAKKYDGSAIRGPERPRVAGRIGSLAVRMASENRTWRYKRIQGALANLGHYGCKEDRQIYPQTRRNYASAARSRKAT